MTPDGQPEPPRFPEGTLGYLVCSLAIATGTSPAHWLGLPIEYLNTCALLLEEQQQQIEDARKG